MVLDRTETRNRNGRRTFYSWLLDAMDYSWLIFMVSCFYMHSSFLLLTFIGLSVL
jgi:hypothetical protein